MVVFIFFIAGLVAAVEIPAGFEQAAWGMTVQELQQVMKVEKVKIGDEFNYAEHMEEDPHIYVRMTEQHERIEYYFFEDRLYKIFIIYDRSHYDTPFYEQLIEDVASRYGLPQKTYEEEFFGLQIQHTLWENEDTLLDLRKGAGFVYQVRTDKTAAQKKARPQKKRKGV
jgi:hypothetical protein